MSLASSPTFRQGIFKSAGVRRIARWLDAMPVLPLAVEIGADRLAAVRWARNGAVGDIAIEPLLPGAMVPSAVEKNLANPDVVRAAMAKACKRLHADDEDIAMILPDPVIRVFVQHFEEFPRSPEEALPILRWKL